MWLSMNRIGFGECGTVITQIETGYDRDHVLDEDDLAHWLRCCSLNAVFRLTDKASNALEFDLSGGSIQLSGSSKRYCELQLSRSEFRLTVSPY